MLISQYIHEQIQGCGYGTSEILKKILINDTFLVTETLILYIL